MIELRRRASPFRFTRPSVALAILLLAGCQTPEAGTGSPPESGWRVVERTGDARTADASTGHVRAVEPGAVLAAGSLVTTGPASRLILTRGQDQISLGPAATLVLSDAPERVLDQRTGTVRYRIAAERMPPLAVRAPTGRAESARGRFEVAIAPDLGRTTFEVAEGLLRVADLGDRRSVTLRDGQSAEAGAAGEDRLAFRRGAGRPLEPVAPALSPIEGPAMPPAAPVVGHAEVRTGIPSGEAAARSVLQAAAIRMPAPPPRRPTAAPANTRPAVLLVAEAPIAVAPATKTMPAPEPVAAEPPRERIILPAGYADRSGSTGSPPGAPAEAGTPPTAVGGQPAAAPSASGFEDMVDGLLEGLDREPAIRPSPGPR